MIKVSWATDIHLDFAKSEAIACFIQDIQNKHTDLLFLTGDLTSHGQADALIRSLHSSINIPIYFVLGNHDFYGSSIDKVRHMIHPSLNYLTHKGVITLSPGIALLGHDGWCDAEAGDYDNSNVDSIISDFSYIEDLKGLSKNDRLAQMRKLSHQSITHIGKNLTDALKNHEKIFLLTHYPPYVEVCLYEGEYSGPNWLPFFVNLSLGKLLVEIMQQHPDKTLNVYCGHSHHAAFYSPLPNISVEVGHAEYGKPETQKTFFIDNLNVNI